MIIEDQGHFFTIYFPGFICFVLYKATISGERLQDHWSSCYHVSINPRFPPFLLYVRCKSGVTFVRKCFLDGFYIGELIVYP